MFDIADIKIIISNHSVNFKRCYVMINIRNVNENKRKLHQLIAIAINNIFKNILHQFEDWIHIQALFNLATG